MKNISSQLLLKNSLYNLAGSIIPLFVALFTIPFLIKGLGEEKFGILSLAWIVIGYFSLFDFGIGRTLTKIVAENIGTDKDEDIPVIFWTSLLLMFIVSLFGSIILFLFTPHLVLNIFKISTIYEEETIYTFYTLAISIPIVTTTAGLRGVLEAYQKFGVINSIKTVLGIFTFVGPLLCLIFTNNLFIIIILLTLIRFVIWIFYYRECDKLESIRKSKIVISKNFIKPIIKISTWMSVSNFIGPLLIYVDRFLIGAMISAVAVTYYTTPYEVITKLLVIPSALTGVLFPAISSNYKINPEYTHKLLLKSIKYVFILIFPVVFVIITFSSEGIYIWLGEDFVEHSKLVLQLLGMGILLNSLAYFPFTFLQSIGRPDITAKIHLFELPFYLLLMVYIIPKLGIIGVAFVWVIRILVDTLLLFYFTQRVFADDFINKHKLHLVFVSSSILMALVSIFLTLLIVKVIFALLVLMIFALVVWKKIINNEDLSFILSRAKSLGS